MTTLATDADRNEVAGVGCSKGSNSLSRQPGIYIRRRKAKSCTECDSMLVCVGVMTLKAIVVPSKILLGMGKTLPAKLRLVVLLFDIHIEIILGRPGVPLHPVAEWQLSFNPVTGM
jgi:hypothetical protein